MKWRFNYVQSSWSLSDGVRCYGWVAAKTNEEGTKLYFTVWKCEIDGTIQLETKDNLESAKELLTNSLK